MARSPIEMMVDQACGIAVDASGKVTELKKPAMQDDAAVAKALERVANFAVAWHFARAENRMTSAIERKLDGAAAKLAELGWQ